jgi:hypothetical protein
VGEVRIGNSDALDDREPPARTRPPAWAASAKADVAVEIDRIVLHVRGPETSVELEARAGIGRSDALRCCLHYAQTNASSDLPKGTWATARYALAFDVMKDASQAVLPATSRTQGTRGGTRAVRSSDRELRRAQREQCAYPGIGSAFDRSTRLGRRVVDPEAFEDLRRAVDVRTRGRREVEGVDELLRAKSATPFGYPPGLGGKNGTYPVPGAS